MSAKVDTIFATFIRRISYLPCKEFGLTDEFIAQNTRRPEEENVIAEDSDQTLDQSKVDDSSDLVESDETKVDNCEDADIGLKRDAGDMSEVPGLESEVDFPVVEMPKTLESTTELQELKRDLFPWIMFSCISINFLLESTFRRWQRAISVLESVPFYIGTKFSKNAYFIFRKIWVMFLKLSFIYVEWSLRIRQKGVYQSKMDVFFDSTGTGVRGHRLRAAVVR